MSVDRQLSRGKEVMRVDALGQGAITRVLTYLPNISVWSLSFLAKLVPRRYAELLLSAYRYLLFAGTT